MDNLIQIVCEEVEKYAVGGRGMNFIAFPVLDDIRQTYTVTTVNYPKRDEFADVIVLARVVGDKVIIEADATDKQLVDALIQRGIPREQIVLAYLGEPIPDAERFKL
ncbi:MAG: XisI protein [Burkholderiales bacterium]|nr:XisI protein [Anaerolineae bacterium]